MRRKLGELLIEAGAASSADVESALADQAAGEPSRLGDLLLSTGKITPAALARALAIQTELPFTDLSYVAPEASALIPLEFQRAHRLVAFRLDREGGATRVHVALSDPTLIDVVDELRSQLKRAVVVHVAPIDDIESVHAALAGESTGEEVVMGEVLEEEELSTPAELEPDVTVELAFSPPTGLFPARKPAAAPVSQPAPMDAFAFNEPQLDPAAHAIAPGAPTYAFFDSPPAAPGPASSPGRHGKAAAPAKSDGAAPAPPPGYSSIPGLDSSLFDSEPDGLFDPPAAAAGLDPAGPSSGPGGALFDPLPAAAGLERASSGRSGGPFAPPRGTASAWLDPPPAAAGVDPGGTSPGLDSALFDPPPPVSGLDAAGSSPGLESALFDSPPAAGGPDAAGSSPGLESALFDSPPAAGGPDAAASSPGLESALFDSPPAGGGPDAAASSPGLESALFDSPPAAGGLDSSLFDQVPVPSAPPPDRLDPLSFGAEPKSAAPPDDWFPEIPSQAGPAAPAPAPVAPANPPASVTEEELFGSLDLGTSPEVAPLSPALADEIGRQDLLPPRQDAAGFSALAAPLGADAAAVPSAPSPARAGAAKLAAERPLSAASREPEPEPEPEPEMLLDAEVEPEADAEPPPVLDVPTIVPAPLLSPILDLAPDAHESTQKFAGTLSDPEPARIPSFAISPDVPLEPRSSPVEPLRRSATLGRIALKRVAVNRDGTPAEVPPRAEGRAAPARRTKEASPPPAEPPAASASPSAADASASGADATASAADGLALPEWMRGPPDSAPASAVLSPAPAEALSPKLLELIERIESGALPSGPALAVVVRLLASRRLVDEPELTAALEKL